MALKTTFQTGRRQVKVSKIFHQVRKHAAASTTTTTTSNTLCSFALHSSRIGWTSGRPSCASLGESFLIRRKGGERNLRVYCSAGEAAGGDEPVDERQELLNRLDIRTGKILSVAEHEEADR